MNKLIWIVYLIGYCLVLLFGGSTGRLLYLIAVTLVIVLFHRRLVVALTHLSSKLGLIRETIDRMPSAIHLIAVVQPTEAARPLLEGLAACKFIDAGHWDIRELPQIHVSLMVKPDDGLLAVVESASPIGAQVNIHMLYSDGRVFSVTNSELPAPRSLPAKVTRRQFPRCAPAALLTELHTMQAGPGVRSIFAAEAPRIYESLYAEAIRVRKETDR